MDWLAYNFFARAPELVAQELIGTVLVFGDKQAMITETEAYLATGDAAAHNTRYGRTPSREALYADAGTLYVHPMRAYVGLDIVTEGVGIPSSVLLRAGLPVQGFAPDIDASHMNGPGKLCKALGITREMNGKSCIGAEAVLHVLPRVGDVQIVTSARIGLARNTDAPLRFFMENK